MIFAYTKQVRQGGIEGPGSTFLPTTAAFEAMPARRQPRTAISNTNPMRPIVSKRIPNENNLRFFYLCAFDTLLTICNQVKHSLALLGIPACMYYLGTCCRMIRFYSDMLMLWHAAIGGRFPSGLFPFPRRHAERRKDHLRGVVRQCSHTATTATQHVATSALCSFV